MASAKQQIGSYSPSPVTLGCDRMPLPSTTRVLILCGGRGIRAFPFTEYLPKPMLPVNGSPILVQIIKGFITQGFTDVVLAAGYRKNVLDDYFEGKDMGGKVRIIDTGENADTGKRIELCESELSDPFVVTYGDGLSDVRISDVLAFHRAHGGLATVTVVPLVTQYGILEADANGRVLQMKEKPVLRDHWINIGFMVFQKSVFDHWTGNNLERDVLPKLARMGELYMYRHEGFFNSLDTYKDQQDIEELVRSGRTPWRS